jgi:hypothetical protein
MVGSGSLSVNYSKKHDVSASCSRGVGVDEALAIVLILERGVVELHDAALTGVGP